MSWQQFSYDRRQSKSKLSWLQAQGSDREGGGQRGPSKGSAAEAETDVAAGQTGRTGQRQRQLQLPAVCRATMLHWHAPCRPQLAIKARVVCFRASAQRGVKGCQRGQKGVQKCNQTHAPANFDWAWQQQRACVCVRVYSCRWQVATLHNAGRNVMVSKGRDKDTWQPCVHALRLATLWREQKQK